VISIPRKKLETCLPRQAGARKTARWNRCRSTVLACCLALLVFPGTAGAVQAHGGAEGLVSHQLGHFLFTLGMGYLLFKLYRRHQAGPGWGAFKAFLWLLILWNVTTFSGHWMHESVSQDKYVLAEGRTVAFVVDSFAGGVFYLTRLDHLLLVPAFVCLLVALKKWSQQP